MKVKQMVIPHVVVACASHMAKTTTSARRLTVNKRKTSGEVREEHLRSGAFLVEFKTPDGPVDMFRRTAPSGLEPKRLHSGGEWQSAVDKYRAMERKGFRVTSDTGCLIPDPQYSTYQKWATNKGHKRTFAFFARWTPAEVDVRNEFGWPCSVQISHLCHRRSCCRVDHLVAEEQWRHLKRNYCGFGGSCDCGNEIKCLRRYQMDAQCDDPPLCTTKSEAEKALEGAPEFVIHGEGRFRNRNVKAMQRKANKLKRIRKRALHAHATERKRQRRIKSGM